LRICQEFLMILLSGQLVIGWSGECPIGLRSRVSPETTHLIDLPRGGKVKGISFNTVSIISRRADELGLGSVIEHVQASRVRIEKTDTRSWLVYTSSFRSTIDTN
jgi:hypothetical protein